MKNENTWAGAVIESTYKRDGYVNIDLDFSKRGAPHYLATKIKDKLSHDIHEFKIRPKGGEHGYYPNLCVPIAGMIDYFRTEYACTFIASSAYRSSRFLANSGVIEPIEFDSHALPGNALNCVWKFSPDTHYDVITELMEAFRRSGVMGKDVLSSLELVLNEVTDNIIQHSQETPAASNAYGYVMGQYHRHNNQIAVAVFDAGRGIPDSLARSGKHFHSTKDALTYSLQKGTTDGNGAGNGLWMMSRIIADAAGRFELISNGTAYSIHHHGQNDVPDIHFNSVGLIKQGTTSIDFQMRTDIELNIMRALQGYEIVDLWSETHLQNDLITLRVKAKDDSRGFGSRYEAQAFAVYILNLLKMSKGQCVIDFSDVSIMSASYADELVKRLISGLGFVTYSNRIVLSGMSDLCKMMIDSCVKSRFT